MKFRILKIVLSMLLFVVASGCISARLPVPVLKYGTLTPKGVIQLPDDKTSVPAPGLDAAGREKALSNILARVDRDLAAINVKMKVLQTEQYVLYSDLGERETEKWFKQLNTMYGDLAVTFGMNGSNSIWRTKSLVVLFKSRSDYVRAAKQFCGKVVPPRMPANNINRRSGDSEILATTEPVPGNSTTIEHILYHELGHAFLMRYKGRVVAIPDWLNEGAAEVIALKYGKADRGVYSANCLRALQKYGSLTPLFLIKGTPMEGLLYNMAGELHSMMYECDPVRYWNFLSWIKYGVNSDVALQRSYGVTRDELSDALGRRYGIELKP